MQLQSLLPLSKDLLPLSKKKCKGVLNQFQRSICCVGALIQQTHTLMSNLTAWVTSYNSAGEREAMIHGAPSVGKVISGHNIGRTGAKYNTYTNSYPEEKANEYIVKSNYMLLNVLTTIYSTINVWTQLWVQRYSGPTHNWWIINGEVEQNEEVKLSSCLSVFLI